MMGDETPFPRLLHIDLGESVLNVIILSLVLRADGVASGHDGGVPIDSNHDIITLDGLVLAVLSFESGQQLRFGFNLSAGMHITAVIGQYAFERGYVAVHISVCALGIHLEDFFFELCRVSAILRVSRSHENEEC